MGWPKNSVLLKYVDFLGHFANFLVFKLGFIFKNKKSSVTLQVYV